MYYIVVLLLILERACGPDVYCSASETRISRTNNRVAKRREAPIYCVHNPAVMEYGEYSGDVKGHPL